MTSRFDWSKIARMIEIQASEAKTRLPQLLTQVEHGETIIITRHGKPIARIVPEADLHRADILKAMEDIRVLGQTMGGVTLDDFTSARREGHKY